MIYLVTELDTGKSFEFNSMDKLLDKYRCVTEARGNRCIDTGEKWKGLVFDFIEGDKDEK